MLLKLKKVVGGGTTHNIIEVLLKMLSKVGGFSQKELLSKFFCLGVNEMNVFLKYLHFLEVLALGKLDLEAKLCLAKIKI